jgi:hypothetical protein
MPCRSSRKTKMRCRSSISASRPASDSANDAAGFRPR